MKITAITRFKCGVLHVALKKLKWSQKELADRCGCCCTTISSIINLRFRPSVELANKIQFVLGEAGEYIDVLSEWPDTFKGLPRGFKIEETQEVEVLNLESCREAFQIPAPDSPYDDLDLESHIGKLKEHERRVIYERFWDGKTFAQCDRKSLGCGSKTTPGLIMVRQNNALRKLRHSINLERKLDSH